MSITPLAFTGVSTFSNDFQTILTRAVNIASLPLHGLQNQESDVLSQKTQLSALTTGVTGLGGALQKLGGFGDNRALAASSSDNSVVSVANTGAETATSYAINEVTSLASAASETSLSGYANSQSTAVSAAGIVKLTVGSSNYSIDLTGKNNLAGLRDAINSLGAGVTASILTAGSSNYLTVTKTAAGATTLALHDDPTGANTSLLSATNQGTDAVFKLNGVAVRRTSNTVNDLIPGLAFTLNGESSSAVTLSVSTDRSQIASALSALASAYNTATTSVSQQVGPGAGLLSGDFLVREVQSRLREVSAFSGTGNVKSLADLGFTFDNSGAAVFDANYFNQLPDSKINDALDFFGSATTGLGAIGNSIAQITDPVTGLAKLQQDSYTQTDTRLRSQIAALSDQIDTLQVSFSARLQAADALIAQLQSQQNVINAGIQSLNLVTFGKNDKSS